MYSTFALDFKILMSKLVLAVAFSFDTAKEKRAKLTK